MIGGLGVTALAGGGGATDMVRTNADNANMTILGAATADSFAAGAYASGNANAASRNSVALVGDFTWQATVGAGANVFNIGIFASAEVGALTSAANGAGGLDVMTESFWWWIQGAGSPGIYKANTRVDTTTFTAGDALKVTRIGGVIKWFKNGTLIHTHAAAYSLPMHVCVMHPNGTINDGTGVFWEN